MTVIMYYITSCQRYKLGLRTHSFTLTCKSSFHDSCNFVTRMLFRDAICCECCFIRYRPTVLTTFLFVLFNAVCHCSIKPMMMTTTTMTSSWHCRRFLRFAALGCSLLSLFVNSPLTQGDPDISFGHIPPDIFPRTFSSPGQFPLLFTGCMTFPLPYHYHHPPTYNIKRPTVNVYKTDSAYGKEYGLVSVFR